MPNNAPISPPPTWAIFPHPLLLALICSTAMPSHAMSIVDVKNAHRINIPKIQRLFSLLILSLGFIRISKN